MSKDNPRVDADNYDPHIIPAETAARREREQEAYKQTPQNSEGDLDTTDGYTTDKEGLINNFAIEPEMYINEPGDLREKEAKEREERKQELAAANQTDEKGKLTMEKDDRSKGVGKI